MVRPGCYRRREAVTSHLNQSSNATHSESRRSSSHLDAVLEPGDDGGRVPGGGALQLQLLAPRHGHGVGRLHDVGRGLHPQLRLGTHRRAVHVPGQGRVKRAAALLLFIVL